MKAAPEKDISEAALLVRLVMQPAIELHRVALLQVSANTKHPRLGCRFGGSFLGRRRGVLVFRRREFGAARQHADNRHHAQILMREDVAVIDEVSNVRTTEVHKHLDLRNRAIRVLHVVPERHLDHVCELANDGRRGWIAVYLIVVLRKNLEVDLVEMPLMVLLGYVADNPFLHRTLRGDDRWRIVVVKERRRCSVDGNEKLSWLDLTEGQVAGSSHGYAAESAEPLLSEI